MTKPRPYREELFQWMWQNLEFDCSQLHTVCGKTVHIIETGEWNHGAGPDFLGAHIRVNGRDWFGSVEIHRKAAEWFQHHHHTDRHFNSVVLHVVYQNDQNVEVTTTDGHQPYTLALKPFLTKKVYRLLEAKQQDGIACSGNVSFINQEAFEKQIAFAHREYLEYKIEELLEFYDASLPLSKAWKDCMIVGMYKTFGIPANKKQMAGLAQKILFEEDSQDISSYIEKVQEIAFGPGNTSQWNESGMRPASRPKPRVRQAAALHYAVVQTPFPYFFKNKPDHSWNHLLQRIDSSLLPGKSRLNLIKQIVFHPALYLLGDLLHSSKLKKQASDAWKSPVQYVPEEIKKPFTKAGFKLNQTTTVSGLAHHYKRYCKQRNCHRCKVFKKAIRS